MRHGRAGARVYGDGGRVVVDDLELDRPVRACACCAREFKPTQRRRLLCRVCFVGPQFPFNHLPDDTNEAVRL